MAKWENPKKPKKKLVLCECVWSDVGKNIHFYNKYKYITYDCRKREYSI